MRRILTLGLGALCLMTFTATQAFALAVAPEPCETNADCQDGFECLLACTETSAEGSEGSEDSQCEGTCEPKSNKNECEVEADCPTGFDCVEHESWAPSTSTGMEPDFSEPPCEGEDCEDPTDEMPNSEPAPEPTPDKEMVKSCEPKMCDADADCGGELVCVLETYECPTAFAPDKEPMPDCPEGEDCGGAPASEEPQEPQEPCEPETVGYCVPKWLAPCEADADCGPGFNCIEEEICWASSGGSMGSSAGAPDRAPCDPDDEDCGGQDSGEGFAPPPEEGEGESEAEEMPSEGCETTGEFYCELQIIDCANEACPEGLVCVSAPEGSDTEDCAVSSDGEMDCEESEDEEIPAQVCVPEDFEDWMGAGSGGQSLGTAEAAEPGSETSNDTTSATDDDPSSDSSSGGSSDSGCAGGGSGAPLGTLALALLVLGFITRRRA